MSRAQGDPSLRLKNASAQDDAINGGELDFKTEH